MWAVLAHCHFLYVLAVLNVVTTGNGTGTKNDLKWNRALEFQSSVYGATTVTKVRKPILYLDMVYCTFLLYVSIEIDPFRCNKHRQFSTLTNFLYLGLVNVNMITATCCS